jgi:hypothetical protein
MKMTYLLVGCTIAWSLFAGVNLSCGQGTAFTYQGKLRVDDGPAYGTNDLRFTIYDSPGPLGNVVSGSLTNPVAFFGTNSFSVTLDFGQNVFNGSPRWLEIAARASGGGAFTTLSPRQLLTPSPYAILAGDVANANIARLDLANPNTPAAGVLQIVNGFVVGATITSNGSGYITAPAVVLNNTGGGAGAVITANISGGHVVSLSVLNAGFGYSPATTLAIDPPPNGAYQIFAGANYFTGINVLNNSANTIAGSFTGNGAGLTNLSGAVAWQTVAGAAVQGQRNSGYLLTNAQTVTLTLPVSPAEGDIVRVSGVGAGGWKIAQNAGQSVLTTSLGPPPLRAVASSADGTKLVAAAHITGRLYTSINFGATWSSTALSADFWSSVASSADGSKLIAAAQDSGLIYASTNSGASWSPTGVPFSGWRSVALSSDASRMAAVSDHATSSIFTSTNLGATWTGHFVESNYWSSVASSADGTQLFAAAALPQFPLPTASTNSGAAIYTSTNSGANWAATSAPLNDWRAVACSADGSKVVAAAAGWVYTSPDAGASWAAVNVPSLDWVSVASSSDGAKLMAASSTSIFSSTNSGASWTALDAPSGTWRGVAISADGTKFVSVGDSVYSSQFTAPATTSGPSGFLVGGQGTAIELQYIGNGQFAPLSRLGAISGY